jgi:hypothetical protein
METRDGDIARDARNHAAAGDFQHWLMENADVVKRCRNHPSVFIFTVGNEMMLRDPKNMKKWELMSQVTKQTRQLARSPDRRLIRLRSRSRILRSTLKPAGIDDGDIDDMHRTTAGTRTRRSSSIRSSRRS